ncbi:MAG: molybdopterin molybdenumtransferase MoeA [Nocardioidaceae bacterium]|nr:molybdopterin molybdenumtransferase MoeA [Nocardioidaceae bacterium]
MPGREFFRTRTVAEALASLPGVTATSAERVGLDEALARIPKDDIVAQWPLPGFARSTVDGYAVQAVDTYGVSEGLPAYLDVIGAVTMGTAPDLVLRPGTAATMPTGGVMPDGADAVVMVEHTQQTIPGTVEVVRPVAPGDGLIKADEDVAVGQLLAPAGRPLRAPDLGMLAAAGVTSLAVHARPVVGICSTGDEVVPPETAELAVGQVRDATASALAGLVREAGGVPRSYGIVADDGMRLERVLRDAVSDCDLVVVSAGSSVGARDETAGAVERLGPPGIVCHGIAVRPGKPTLLAQCGEVPVVGLPGNPLSALVVFRLVGMPLVRRVGGCTRVPPEPRARARLTRQLASQAGRLDVIQVRLEREDGQLVASPLFGASALLSVLTAADGYTIVPEEATGLDAGVEVDVTLYR